MKDPFEEEWQSLCERYLPVNPPRGVWRFSRFVGTDDPAQGWKLHISATIVSANEVFKRVAPLLSRSDVLFKAPRSLKELNKINTGLHYGFSQIGKFITVFPKNAEDATALANKLHRVTHGFPSPAVPYDEQFRRNGIIYYRYGAFGSIEIEQKDSRVSALMKPDGTLVPDEREPGMAVPGWLKNPFASRRRVHIRAKTKSPLMTTIRAYEALSQRGKGGVYRALDLSVAPARLCVLKEGRRHGETDYFGRDGCWRVKQERRVLAALRASGIKVPKIYRTFEVDEHFYLVTEFIEGDNLQTIISRRRTKLTRAQTMEYAVQIAKLMRNIHAAGWVWRDCKPLNLIISREGTVRPVDFEGACPISVFDPTPWGTPGYASPLPPPLSAGSRMSDDLYALGATLHHLFSGRRPSIRHPLRPLDKSIPGVPLAVKQVTNSLLDPDPGSRPTTHAVCKTLAAACSR